MRPDRSPSYVALLMWTLAACAAEPIARGIDPGGVAGIAAQPTARAGSGVAGNDFGGAHPGVVPVADAGPPKLQSACVGKTQVAQLVPLDMYIMLDRSDSMQEATGAGPTKWDAIRKALTSFVQDAKSSGLGVGLQYFPLGTAGVPDSCMVDSDCGAKGGQCISKACLGPLIGPTNFAFTLCLSAAHCPLSSRGCARFGLCSMDDTLACFNLGADGCQAQGDCLPYAGECTDYGSCIVSDYAKPAVPIATLPDNAVSLVASLNFEKTRGLTPTPAALSGALNLATQHAGLHPDHRVITVLATDGLPTQCLPASATTAAQAVTATAQIAAQGFSATPSILTYVIGVFAPDDPNAISNLNQLAVAGGTKQAFIVDQSGDVTQQLIEALAAIRSGSLACEYQLPASPAGQALDFDLVNVEFNPKGMSTQSLAYVGSADKCAKAALGWFYDVDPHAGQTPTKISVCPKTCDTLRAATGATVQVSLGCVTLGPQ